MLCESAPGRASGSDGQRERAREQRGSRSKDVATWRWMGSVKLVVSLLRSAFRLLSMGMRTKKQPMGHHALLPQEFRWRRYGKPGVQVDPPVPFGLPSAFTTRCRSSRSCTPLATARLGMRCRLAASSAPSSARMCACFVLFCFCCCLTQEQCASAMTETHHLRPRCAP